MYTVSPKIEVTFGFLIVKKFFENFVTNVATIFWREGIASFYDQIDLLILLKSLIQA